MRDLLWSHDDFTGLFFEFRCADDYGRIEAFLGTTLLQRLIRTDAHCGPSECLQKRSLKTCQCRDSAFRLDARFLYPCEDIEAYDRKVFELETYSPRRTQTLEKMKPIELVHAIFSERSEERLPLFGKTYLDACFGDEIDDTTRMKREELSDLAAKCRSQWTEVRKRFKPFVDLIENRTPEGHDAIYHAGLLTTIATLHSHGYFLNSPELIRIEEAVEKAFPHLYRRDRTLFELYLAYEGAISCR